jgi:carbon storage regulator CsrA
MLVLSRRLQQKVVIPDLQTTIQVVSIKGNTVGLSFEAPQQVRIYREEVLARKGPLGPPPESPAEAQLRELRHVLNNRINTSVFGLAVLRRQLELGRIQDMPATLDRLDDEVAALRQRLEALQSPPAPVAPPALAPRALLVEDDRNECELLAGFLRLAGIEVGTASDGADALDYLEKHERPDIVLLDMIMPRCDGPTTVRAIRRNPNWQGLKVFGVTGTSDTFGLEEGPCGVNRWFRKPLDPTILLGELKRELPMPA